MSSPLIPQTATYARRKAKNPEKAKLYGKELTKLTEQYNSKIMGLNKHIEKYLGDPELLKQIRKSVRRHLRSSTIVLY